VSVINPTTDTVIATIGVGGAPFGVAVSPIGPEAGDVFVANGDGGVSVINPATDTVIGTIGVGSPEGVAVSPTGPEAGDVFVVNTGNNTVSVIS
jgi:YVTN family beta-propeller protein